MTLDTAPETAPVNAPTTQPPQQAPRSVENQRAVLSQANQSSQRGRRTALMAVIVLAAIIGAAFAGFFYINREQPDLVLTIGAGPRGTDAFQLMSELSQVVERHGEGIRLNVLATEGSSENVRLLNTHQIDIATIGGGTPVVSNVRLVSHLFSDFFNVIARSDARIRRFGDLEGKLIALPPDGSDGLRSFWAVADHYDLPSQTVRFISMPFKAAHNALLNKQVDAVFTLSSLRDRPLLALFEDAELTNVSLEVIPVEQAEAISLKRPFVVPDRIPRGAFTGAIPAPRWETTTATIRRNLVSRSDVSDEAIRELTRVLHEHRLDLTVRFALAGSVSQPDPGQGLTVPLHAGAEAFYSRDEPTYLQENAEPLALGVTVTAMLASMLLALRSRFAAGQKNRADKYNHQLLQIAREARVAATPGHLDALAEQLTLILETVVIALDTDEVTDEGFQSFSLLWESVRDEVRHRRSALTA